MPYVNMKEMLEYAQKEKCAIGAFNIFNHLTACSVINAAEKKNYPVILQTSVSTVKYYQPDSLIEMLRPLVSRSKVPVAVHLDHCIDLTLAKQCIDVGWSSVMFDASQKPFDENIRLTKEIVDYAKAKGVTVEGELGRLAGVEDEIEVTIGEEMLAGVNDSILFMKKTGVDAFAPAIGTAHGLYKKTPNLNFERLRQIVNNSQCPIVIHGGTGLKTEDFRELVHCGASKINISTAIKLAYLNAIREYLRMYHDEHNPLALQKYTLDHVENVVNKYIEIFDCR